MLRQKLNRYKPKPNIYKPSRLVLGHSKIRRLFRAKFRVPKGTDATSIKRGRSSLVKDYAYN